MSSSTLLELANKGAGSAPPSINVVPHHVCFPPAYLHPGRKSFDDQVLLAAKTGNLRKLKKLGKELGKKMGNSRGIANFEHPEGRLLLHVAAKNGSTNICKYLIEEMDFAVDEKDFKGSTPLLHACLKGDISTAEYLIEKGADPRALQRQNTTCLHMASYEGHIEVIHLLLSKGVDVNAPSYFGTSLQISRSQPDVIKILLDHGASPNICSGFPPSALKVCMITGSLVCTKLLIQAGADPNCFDGSSTPLFYAAKVGEVKYVTYLLEAGADPNIPDDDGLKPIEIAAERGHHQVVEILFPVTSPIPACTDWSIPGLIKYVHSEEARKQANLKRKENHSREMFKGDDALKKNEFWLASQYYSLALALDPGDATAFSMRSLCFARDRMYDVALYDADACTLLRPEWAEAYLRKGVALSLLKKFDMAEEALKFGLKLEPENIELQNALQEVVEARKKPGSSVLPVCMC